MNFVIKCLSKLFDNPTWEMDPEHKVDWKTNYDTDVVPDFEKDIIRFRRKQELVFARVGLRAVKLRNAVRNKFGLKTNEAYIEKITELIGLEAEAILLDAPRDEELHQQLNNILLLGDDYDPKYDHEAYIAKAKRNSITG